MPCTADLSRLARLRHQVCGGGRELGTQQWQLVAVAELLAMTDIAAFVQNCVNADGSAAGTQSGCVA